MKIAPLKILDRFHLYIFWFVASTYCTVNDEIFQTSFGIIKAVKLEEKVKELVQTAEDKIWSSAFIRPSDFSS